MLCEITLYFLFYRFIIDAITGVEVSYVSDECEYSGTFLSLLNIFTEGDCDILITIYPIESYVNSRSLFRRDNSTASKKCVYREL